MLAGFMRGRRSTVALAIAGILLTRESAAGPAEDARRVPLGFSKMLVRIQGTEEIGLTGPEMRVSILEYLRSRGFNAVGAENLVFDQDAGRRARFVIGGTVRELACHAAESSRSNCRIGVEWQLLDADRDVVVYSVLTRHAVMGRKASARAERNAVAAELLRGAVDALVIRPKFVSTLSVAPVDAEKDATFPSASLARCTEVAGKMPAGAESVLSATVVIRTASGHGSGLLLNEEGFVLTAAHVVDAGQAKIQFRNGKELEATLVRVARSADIALLRLPRGGRATTCVAPATTDASVGAEVYAAGAPADIKLGFSLTRGIVSAVREVNGRPRIQTDAAVSPGNSGGPLVDADGRVAAVVVTKIDAARVEGIAFGVPIATALSSVGIWLGDRTDAKLFDESTPLRTSAPSDNFVDSPDQMPSIDPEGDRLREEERRAEAVDRATPQRLKTARLAAPLVAFGGFALVLWTAKQSEDGSITRAEYNRARLVNTVGWGAVFAGAALGTWAWTAGPNKGNVSLLVAPTNVAIGGVFQ